MHSSAKDFLTQADKVGSVSDVTESEGIEDSTVAGNMSVPRYGELVASGETVETVETVSEEEGGLANGGEGLGKLGVWWGRERSKLGLEDMELEYRVKDQELEYRVKDQELEYRVKGQEQQEDAATVSVEQEQDATTVYVDGSLA